MATRTPLPMHPASYGGFCTLLAGLQALLALAALAAVYVQMRREREQRRQQLSSRGCSGGGEAAGTKQLLAAQA